MKAEDLMIGNWVYNNLLKKPITVSNGHFLRTYSTKHLEPIPVTEENIVELLGFKRKFSGLYWYKSTWVSFTFNKVKINGDEITLPKHVHKLQQLIKSL